VGGVKGRRQVPAVLPVASDSKSALDSVIDLSGIHDGAINIRVIPRLRDALHHLLEFLFVAGENSLQKTSVVDSDGAKRSYPVFSTVLLN
jgi:hypothetical protein